MARETAEQFLARAGGLVEKALDELTPLAATLPPVIHQAMRYSLLGGGKRLRPALALAAGELVGGTWGEVREVACAVEMIHTYSLIHDDLPALDNDELRRGNPSCHVVYGEALAILAGDALLTLAFETAACAKRREVVPRLIRVLASQAGTRGMIGGQVLDLVERKEGACTLAEVRTIHERKTGALISAALECGALAAGAGEEDCLSLAHFGRQVGLAFQVADDVLDRTATAEALGKTPGKDVAAGKATYPAVVGLEESRRIAAELVVAARTALASRFGERAALLAELAGFAVQRTG